MPLTSGGAVNEAEFNAAVFGNLERVRAKLGLDHAEMAALMGVKKRAYYWYKSGKLAPRAYRLWRLKQATGEDVTP